MHDWHALSYRNGLLRREKARRLVWEIVWACLFRPTPHWALSKWRSALLRAFGAQIAPGAVVRPSCRIWAPWNLTMGPYACLGDRVDCYCVAPISLGSNAAVSQDSFLCTATHDIRSLKRELIAKPITIGDHAWVAARAFVGPGITIHEGAVVGACAVVTKDAPSWTFVAGNPARVVRPRTLAEPAGTAP